METASAVSPALRLFALENSRNRPSDLTIRISPRRGEGWLARVKVLGASEDPFIGTLSTRKTKQVQPEGVTLRGRNCNRARGCVCRVLLLQARNALVFREQVKREGEQFSPPRRRRRRRHAASGR